MPVPDPTPIYRFTHVDNLHICLKRRGLYAPNATPNDGLVYKTIHNEEIQQERHIRKIPCGPRGSIHDYIPFYFGYLSPMLFQLKTGWVAGYNEGQEPLIYLVSTVQDIQQNAGRYVFSDGHGIAAYTSWFDDLKDLDKVDWNMVYQRYWKDEPDVDMDRQRRKQAEFLVHKYFNWSLIHEIAVIDSRMKDKVEGILAGFPQNMHRPVKIRRHWYY